MLGISITVFVLLYKKKQYEKEKENLVSNSSQKEFLNKKMMLLSFINVICLLFSNLYTTSYIFIFMSSEYILDFLLYGFVIFGSIQIVLMLVMHFIPVKFHFLIGYMLSLIANFVFILVFQFGINTINICICMILFSELSFCYAVFCIASCISVNYKDATLDKFGYYGIGFIVFMVIEVIQIFSRETIGHVFSFVSCAFVVIGFVISGYVFALDKGNYKDKPILTNIGEEGLGTEDKA